MTGGKNLKACVIMSIFLLGMGCTAAAGRTIYVDDDGSAEFDNIQAAINDANNGDTIIVADGIFTGEGNRDIDFLGKAITLRSENGPENCIIDCNGTEAEPHQGFFFIVEKIPTQSWMVSLSQTGTLPTAVALNVANPAARQ